MSKDFKTYLDLFNLNNRQYYFYRDSLDVLKKELETLIQDESYLNTKQFAKKVLFTHEIKANNQVEGYKDDIALIDIAIKHVKTFKEKYTKQRIINLYNAYHYILNHHDINKESLKELYSITSKHLLTDKDIFNMGSYYRQAPVYILKSGRLDIEPDQGLPAPLIDNFMDEYFTFLNNNLFYDQIDEYIKSQILHYYFVYIHPYFDVNGRTSRTLAMWYLLNKKAYPFIIFNRGISQMGNKYDLAIRLVNKRRDLTPFLKMMLKTVKIELEKEYVMHHLVSNSIANLQAKDYQTILYLLAMKGNKTIFDFATYYNNNNAKKSLAEIYREFIEPLLDCGIIEKGKTLTRKVNNMQNFYLKLRQVEELDYSKIRDLNLE